MNNARRTRALGRLLSISNASPPVVVARSGPSHLLARRRKRSRRAARTRARADAHLLLGRPPSSRCPGGTRATCFSRTRARATRRARRPRDHTRPGSAHVRGSSATSGARRPPRTDGRLVYRDALDQDQPPRARRSDGRPHRARPRAGEGLRAHPDVYHPCWSTRRSRSWSRSATRRARTRRRAPGLRRGRRQVRVRQARDAGAPHLERDPAGAARA